MAQDYFNLEVFPLTKKSPEALQKRLPETWFWQGQKDLPRASHSYGSPTVAVQQYPSRRSSLKTVHRTVFLTLRPSRVQVLIKKRAALLRLFPFGRGRRTWSRLPARSVLLHTSYAEVSTGDPHPSTRSACLGSRFVPAKNGHLSASVSFLAGAEGLEPSARGFGDHCSTN